jgi:hypothetical protein
MSVWKNSSMLNPIMRTVQLIVAVLVLTAFLAASLAAAQVQNPIQAIKDAYNSAKQQQPPQQQQPQQASAAPAAGGAQAQKSPQGGAGAPNFDVPAAAGAYGNIADYKVMPDVLGIRLGMPLPEAYATLQRAYPKDRIDNYPINMPTAAKPPTIALAVHQNGASG